MRRVAHGGDAWRWRDDGDVASAPCALCGGESVGAGFGARFWAMQLVRRAVPAAALVVAVCDRCEPGVCEGETVRLRRDDGVDGGTAIVDALHRQND